MDEDFDRLCNRQEEFIEQRDWEQYHTPKNLSMALSVEAAELMELLQWEDNRSPEAVAQDAELTADIQDELADIVIYSMSMANQLDIDLLAAVDEKLDKNQERF